MSWEWTKYALLNKTFYQWKMRFGQVIYLLSTMHPIRGEAQT